MKRKLLPVFLLVSLILLLAPPATVTAQESQTARVGLLSPLNTLDPALVETDTDALIVEQLFLGLVEIDEEGNPQPELAEAWEAIDGTQVWTFHLRQGVQWVDSDGTPQSIVTSQDVKWAIDRARELGLFGEIIEEVSQQDDFTVTFFLTEPYAAFPSLMAETYAKPLPMQIIQEYGDSWTQPGRIWSNGPYLLLDRTDTRVQLEANLHWWGAPEVQVRRVRVEYIEDPGEALHRYQGGDLDLIQLAPDLRPSVMQDEGLAAELHRSLLGSTYTYGFNTAMPPFDNPLVRRAFAHSVDRENLCQLLGRAVPTKRLIPSGVFGNTPGLGLDYDPDLARQLMAEAGYPSGAGFPAVMLLYNISEYHEAMARMVAAEWGNLLGVFVEPEGVSFASLIEQIGPNTAAEYAPDIFRLTYSGTSEADSWLDPFNSQRGGNYIRWSNAVFDELTYGAHVDPDPGRRLSFFSQAESVLVEQEAGIIPVCQYFVDYLSKPYLLPTYSLAFGLGGFHHWKLTYEEPSVSIPETTRVLDDETLNALVSMSDDQSVLVFDRMTPQLSTIQVNDIIAGNSTIDRARNEAPYGFLRRVTTTYTDSAGQLVIETIQAALDEAIERGDLTYTATLQSNDVYLEEIITTSALPQRSQFVRVNYVPPQVDFKVNIDHVVYDEDGDKATTDDQVKAMGWVKIEPDIDFTLKLDVDNYQLQSLYFSGTATETAHVELSSQIDVMAFEKTIPIKRYTFMPQTILIGWVPVVITPQLTVYVGANGNVSVGVSACVEQHATMTSGVQYELGSWIPVKEISGTIDPVKTTLTHSAKAEAFAGPELSIKLYGAAGPYGRVKAYFKLSADPSESPWWTLHGGVKVELGMKIEVFSHVIAGCYHDLTISEELLAQSDGQVIAPIPPANGDGRKTCDSIWWPPSCWKWWLWAIVVIVIIIIILMFV